MSSAALVVGWGRMRAAREGRPGMPVLPGSDAARELGCVCPAPHLSGGRAAVLLDHDCPAPRYPLHGQAVHTTKGWTPGTTWGAGGPWHYHWTPWADSPVSPKGHDAKTPAAL